MLISLGPQQILAELGKGLIRRFLIEVLRLIKGFQCVTLFKGSFQCFVCKAQHI